MPSWARCAKGIALLSGFVLLHNGLLRPDPPQSPAWLRDGIVASSDMEALTFILRRGGEPEAIIQQWHVARSEEAVRKLKAEGVNFAITNLQRGAESQDMAAARAKSTTYDWIGRGRMGRNGFDSRWRYHLS